MTGAVVVATGCVTAMVVALLVVHRVLRPRRVIAQRAECDRIIRTRTVVALLDGRCFAAWEIELADREREA